MPALQRLAANATHWALYALMIAVPLSGWLMSSAKGFQTVWFGVLPLPDLVAKDAALGDLLQDVHEDPQPHHARPRPAACRRRT